MRSIRVPDRAVQDLWTTDSRCRGAVDGLRALLCECANRRSSALRDGPTLASNGRRVNCRRRAANGPARADDRRIRVGARRTSLTLPYHPIILGDNALMAFATISRSASEWVGASAAPTRTTLVLAITGASGSIFAVEMLRALEG